MRLVFDKSDAVTKWVAARIPFVGDRGFGPCTSIGIVGKDGQELAGFVFHDFQPSFKTISVSIASENAMWCRKRILKLLFTYPFVDAGVNKLWSSTPSNNAAALRLAKACGFRKEAVLAHHFGMGIHAVINRMMRNDWIRLHGSIQRGEQSLISGAGLHHKSGLEMSA